MLTAIKASKGYYLAQYFKYLLLTFLFIIIIQAIIFTLLTYFSPEIIAIVENERLFTVAISLLLFIIVISIVVAWLITRSFLKRKYDVETLITYSKLIDNSSDLIVIHDFNGKIYYLNQKAEIMLGLKKKEYSRANLFTYLKTDSSSKNDNLGELESGQPINYESVIVRDEINLPVEINSQPVLINGKKLVIDVIKDISERKQSAEELKQSSEKLQKAMEGTIDTLAHAAEVRDPYTAGHQQRVSLLSIAIANELGLSQIQIDGVRVASSLHDIGKIYVPAEILSKPGKLKVNEFNLVRDHSEVGYELLKSIEFPWPVAEIILQHHERLDGSGYPRGLIGNDIMIEASIIAVSDVVESMSSHRPYRPAYNIEKALLEILQHRGVLYHPEVVDACMRLFNEKGFKF